MDTHFHFWNKFNFFLRLINLLKCRKYTEYGTKIVNILVYLVNTTHTHTQLSLTPYAKTFSGWVGGGGGGCIPGYPPVNFMRNIYIR